MRVITCAGFYRTGSSAISDLFSEFECVHSMGDFEFRFVQDPDGISDLEYNICENPHRHNTSYAIKRFLKYSKFLNGSFYSKRYSAFFGQKYERYTEEYIKDITELVCKSWWHRDQLDRGKIFYFIDRLYSKICTCFDRRKNNVSLLKNETGYYTAIDKETFYQMTRKYINKLLEICNKNQKEFIMLDQLVPPTNIERYLNYFDDIKVIVVERDPRDLFLLENEFYRWGVIPYQDVRDFCEWYRITRSQAKKTENENILYIYFEDLIYKYEETRTKLMCFTGIRANTCDKQYAAFRPEESKKNTKLYKNSPLYVNEINYIEKHLKNFLYLE